MKNESTRLKPSALTIAMLGLFAGDYVLAAPLIKVISGNLQSFSVVGVNYDSVGITSTGSISGNAFGINNHGAIGTLTNDGAISATYYGIYGYSGNIGTLTNNGNISGGETGIFNDSGSEISSLVNSGTISGLSKGIYNDNARIGTLENKGIISGEVAIKNHDGDINSIINSGTISGTVNAIYNSDVSGNIGIINNSGSILGNINSANGLTIAGGTGSFIGKLTGYVTNSSTSSIGSIHILSGDLTFSGGNLLLNNDVTIDSGALKNTGSALYLANSITVNGNYSQSAAASLNSYVYGANTYGQLVVNGSASIASGSSINLINQNYAFVNGQRYVVIKATTGNYNVAGLSYTAAGYSGAVTGSTETEGSYTNLVLTLGHGNSSSSAAQATTYNARSSLNGLQRYTGTSNAALLNLFNASLAIGSTAEGNRAGGQLSPHQNASAGQAARTATFDMLGVIGRHLGAGGAVRVAQGGSSGISTGEAGPSQAVWGQAFGGHASQGMSHDVSGYRANYSGAVFGYDRAVNNDWRVGGALSYSYTKVNGDEQVQGSSSNVASLGLTAYASYVAPTWYSNLYATVVGQRYNTQRVVDFTGYHGEASGKFNGQQYVLNAELGYPLALSNAWTVTPIASLSYSQQRQNGYTESGGNGAALQVGSTRSESIQSGLGARLDTQFETRWGSLVPYAQLMWNHQYNDRRMVISAAYAADASNTGFTSLGSSPAKNSANLSLGATLQRSNDTSLTAYYTLTKASHYTNQAVSLRFRQAF